MHAHYSIPGLTGALMEFMLVGIIGGYLVIAWQFWRARVTAKAGARITASGDDAASAVTYLMAIFILCALCGYAPRLIAFPMTLFVALHAALFLATWSYVLTRQAVAIAAALDHG